MKRLLGTIALWALALNPTLSLANGRSCKLTNLGSVESRVHFNLDQFSPYALANYPSSDSMAKISENTLDSLMILRTDLLWLSFNIDLGLCGISAVSKRNQAAVITAGDVLVLIKAKLQGSQRAIMTRSFDPAIDSFSSVTKETIEIKVD